MKAHEELFQLADALTAAASVGDAEEIAKPMEALQRAIESVGRSFSGSWLGYHSRVYYAGLATPPPGSNFSPEWGLEETFASMGSTGDWEEFDSQSVKTHILQAAGNPKMKSLKTASESAAKVFNSSKAEILSIIENELEASDGFLGRLKGELEQLSVLIESAIVRKWQPTGTVMTRDSLAMSQGTQLPPHVEALAEVSAIRHPFMVCREAADICKKAASHIERRARRAKAADRVGTNVFIGHGRSPLWREIKDFIKDRLGLPWDEFNRVPVAGVTNIARLSEMLDAAAIALLVMTAEDELADGDLQARMNVVHEAGMFQGRLGFTRAIVLLEAGCKEFSNIQGLGQIRFPKGNIAACFEEVRRVLEREGLVNES